jgi:inosine-uridine nucleoside N-ribohydrolase
MAIILAGHNAKINLLGVSTVAGNQLIDKVTRNTLDILEVSGLDVDVVQGAAAPIFSTKVLQVADVHGESGLGAKLPRSPKSVVVANAIAHIYERIKNHPEKVTIIATGPLTNIALLLQTFPDIREYIEQIVFMGGAIGLGNQSPAAEFNIFTDPDAAHIVFHSKVKVVMVPLEVTHTVLATKELIADFRAHDSILSNSIAECLWVFADWYFVYEKLTGAPLHDTCAVAYVIDPKLLECELMNVEVERHSQFNNGRTVCDLKNVTGRPKNVHVCTKINVDEAWKLIFNAVDTGNVKSKYGLNKQSDL